METDSSFMDSLLKEPIIETSPKWFGRTEKVEELSHEPQNFKSDYIGLVFILGLLLITIARFLAPKRFSAIFSSVNPFRARNFGSFEYDSLSGLPFVFFVIFSIISLALGLFEVNNLYMNVSFESSSPLILLFLFVAVILVFLLYKIAYVGISSILFKHRESAEYYFQNLFNQLLVLSVVIFPLIIFNHYAGFANIHILIISVAAFFFLMNLIDAYIIARRFSKISHFYIILYLCMLEIAPVIWLYTLV